jgi:hypothetical protein
VKVSTCGSSGCILNGTYCMQPHRASVSGRLTKRALLSLFNPCGITATLNLVMLPTLHIYWWKNWRWPQLRCTVPTLVITVLKHSYIFNPSFYRSSRTLYCAMHNLMYALFWEAFLR